MEHKPFWDLFWTTGMPEAWLMSRGPDVSDRPAGLEEVSGPLAPPRPSRSGNVPGGPERLY